MNMTDLFNCMKIMNFENAASPGRSLKDALKTAQAIVCRLV